MYESLADFGGSVSAEHGIGLEKKKWFPISRTAVERGLMQDIKRLLDPNGILNPGKLFDADSASSKVHG
ncbi:putative FAD-linked oxidoreductase [compost metagenome]